ncbi:MAG: dimethylaniline monooxygenase (N-oxide forming) [Gammaproteobacteria bacterium]|jgi:dimethylaniline monooxygenase (N-oxide forming)
MRIAIIGAGISGIAFARVLNRFGHECTLFDKAPRIGGIWALTYPDVRLQNSREQYTFSDFPWPQEPDQHPSAEQILNYLEAAVEHYGLDVRLEHCVTQMLEVEGGWTLTVEHDKATQMLTFDYVVISIGQYAERKYRPEFPGEAEFSGQVLTERDVKNLEIFSDKKVAVVGFGKSAVDMCSFAAPTARSVAHVFRTPRWLIPFRILGTHYTYVFFARATTVFMPSWVHATRIEHALHRYCSRLVGVVWKTIEFIVRKHIARHVDAGNPDSARGLKLVTPSHSFAGDLRSATAMAPVNYYKFVANGTVKPYHSEVSGFDGTSLLLSNGESVDADVVVLSVGSGTPVFPFLPSRIRSIIEQENDGVQLYRHLVHPEIPRLAFAGYNHGFMHIPAAEMGALWLCAVWRGDIELPGAAIQEQSINTIRDWKRANINYEPSRACAVSTRFQQHLDGLLIEMGVSPYRKMPNVFAEIFARYGGADYAGIVDEVLNRSAIPARSIRSMDI